METYIGVDIGTTSTKTVIYDKDATILATTTVFYPLFNSEPDQAEEDPDEILNAVVKAIHDVLSKAGVAGKDVAALSFSAQQHSLMAIDADGKPLMRLQTWADNRSEKYVAAFKKTADAKPLYERTGVPTHPMAPIFKMMWVRSERPDVYAKAAYWIGIKEYVLYKMFGELIEDYSVASSTGLLNLEKLDWDAGALNIVGIKREQLPKLASSVDKITGMKAEYVERTGLTSETPFVLGASDGSMANVGVGAIDGSTMAITIGTSAAIRSIVDKPLIDPKARVYCYPLIPNEKWIIGGPINNGGVVFRWVRDHLFDDLKDKTDGDPYDYLTAMAAKVPAGANGLLFLPYLEGERAPIWDANARGAFFGLNESHSREEMVRAVLEGIVFNIYSVMLTMREVTGNVDNIMATGGFARSELWCQMMADIFDSTVKVPEAFESGCLGAMVLAQIGVGAAKDLSVVKKYIGHVKSYTPNPKNRARYQELMEIFISATRNLSGDYGRIADYQRKYQGKD